MNIRRHAVHASTLLLLSGCGQAADGAGGPVFAVSFPSDRSAGPLSGRLLLMLAEDGNREPRFQISAGPHGQQVFGIDVHDLAPGMEATIDAKVFGFPRTSLAEVPTGTYWVQALINRYERFERSDGHVLELPPDRGEGQRWNKKPGNLYSVPRRILIDPSSPEVVHLSLDREVPPLPEEDDSRYVKHVRIQSELLTAFWGRPISVEATVLLPDGWAEHPDAHYPIVVDQTPRRGDVGRFVAFRESPPAVDEDLEGSDLAMAQAGYRLYQDWTRPDFPRFILVTIRDPNPYNANSFAVNSANLGPYGDALTYELLPHIETRFRGIGRRWARVLYGESTGGWESLALQLFYPDEYNGAWALCPEPFDFSDFAFMDLYREANAYYRDSGWKRKPRPGRTDTLGNVTSTLEEENHLELVLATRGRSGGRWDLRQAVFGPAGADGYPVPVWDKVTGEIDPAVASYWREHYDLRHLLERDWPKLASSLSGKLHIDLGGVGGADSSTSFRLAEELLGRAAEGWRCLQPAQRTHRATRRTINRRLASFMLDRILGSAPQGADVVSWRY